MKISGDLNFHLQPVLEVRFINNQGEFSPTMMALIDTGSYFNFVSESAFGGNKVFETGNSFAYGDIKGSNEQANECLLTIKFNLDESDRAFTLPCGILKNSLSHVHMILGTSFLSEFNFKFEGSNKKFYLEFKPQ